MSLTSPIPTRQRIWKALRVQKICDARLLAAAASASEATTRDFLRLLDRAGYVEIIANGSGRVGHINRYRLIRDTGPRAPHRLFDFVQDNNTGKLMPLKPQQRKPRISTADGGDGHIDERARAGAR